MYKARFNKDVSGYLMLSILAEADGDFDAREGTVIIDYIKKTFPFGSNLETAADELSNLSPDKYEEELKMLAQDFYTESTAEERTDFLRFAMQLVRADNEVSNEENKMITRLFEAWDV